MKFGINNTQSLSSLIRSGDNMGWRRQLSMVVMLSIPSILSQVSAVAMEYIDASMVGQLGADASASIGLVATTTWLFFGLCSAASMGFSVQVAHLLGAGKHQEANSVLRQSIIATLIFSSVLALLGVCISHKLPIWLGGDPAICSNASVYFILFAVSLPPLQLSFLAGGMLRSSGNMVVPAVVGALMCVFDVVFNFFLIFPTRSVLILGLNLTVPGAGMGVSGAAIGTGLAEIVSAAIMLWYIWKKGNELTLSGASGRFLPSRSCIRKAFTIGMPMGIERAVSTGAQITLTAIVAPLGIASIAANAFAITAEGICYMPGYGIAEAATTLVGQSLGAGKKFLARKFANVTIALGMAVMTVMGVIMYIGAPVMIGIMTPDHQILDLGVRALRTEAFAEPMFAAAIVAYGVFVGAGDTIYPSLMNLGSIWVIRVTLAAILAPVFGLHGVWIAMCIELCCRGAMFLCRLKFGAWMAHADKIRD